MLPNEPSSSTATFDASPIIMGEPLPTTSMTQKPEASDTVPSDSEIQVIHTKLAPVTIKPGVCQCNSPIQPTPRQICEFLDREFPIGYTPNIADILDSADCWRAVKNIRQIDFSNQVIGRGSGVYGKLRQHKKMAWKDMVQRREGVWRFFNFLSVCECLRQRIVTMNLSLEWNMYDREKSAMQQGLAIPTPETHPMILELQESYRIASLRKAESEKVFTILEALKMINAPLPEGFTPDAPGLVDSIEGWRRNLSLTDPCKKKPPKMSLVDLANSVLGCTDKVYRKMRARKAEWNELLRAQKFVLRMHNWIEMTEEVKEKIMKLKISTKDWTNFEGMQNPGENLFLRDFGLSENQKKKLEAVKTKISKIVRPKLQKAASKTSENGNGPELVNTSRENSPALAEKVPDNLQKNFENALIFEESPIFESPESPNSESDDIQLEEIEDPNFQEEINNVFRILDAKLPANFVPDTNQILDATKIWLDASKIPISEFSEKILGCLESEYLNLRETKVQGKDMFAGRELIRRMYNFLKIGEEEKAGILKLDISEELWLLHEIGNDEDCMEEECEDQEMRQKVPEDLTTPNLQSLPQIAQQSVQTIPEDLTIPDLAQNALQRIPQVPEGIPYKVISNSAQTAQQTSQMTTLLDQQPSRTVPEDSTTSSLAQNAQERVPEVSEAVPILIATNSDPNQAPKKPKRKPKKPKAQEIPPEQPTFLDANLPPETFPDTTEVLRKIENWRLARKMRREDLIEMILKCSLNSYRSLIRYKAEYLRMKSEGQASIRRIFNFLNASEEQRAQLWDTFWASKTSKEPENLISIIPVIPNIQDVAVNPKKLTKRKVAEEKTNPKLPKIDEPLVLEPDVDEYLNRNPKFLKKASDKDYDPFDFDLLSPLPMFAEQLEREFMNRSTQDTPEFDSMGIQEIINSNPGMSNDRIVAYSNPENQQDVVYSTPETQNWNQETSEPGYNNSNYSIPPSYNSHQGYQYSNQNSMSNAHYSNPTGYSKQSSNENQRPQGFQYSSQNYSNHTRYSSSGDVAFAGHIYNTTSYNNPHANFEGSRPMGVQLNYSNQRPAHQTNGYSKQNQMLTHQTQSYSNQNQIPAHQSQNCSNQNQNPAHQNQGYSNQNQIPAHQTVNYNNQKPAHQTQGYSNQNSPMPAHQTQNNSNQNQIPAHQTHGYSNQNSPMPTHRTQNNSNQNQMPTHQMGHYSNPQTMLSPVSTTTYSNPPPNYSNPEQMRSPMMMSNDYSNPQQQPRFVLQPMKPENIPGQRLPPCPRQVDFEKLGVKLQYKQYPTDPLTVNYQ
ncbi:hypothetical protein L3Y34_003033 [Caenorhabditis briggsae]|uniref:CUT domain-containing protein n=1 Tax=Caenorhabditis briggsae TaxID=6238 RepID=A0AAE9D3N1_CAEBR|nr:hypothetical protein L3Y34_003033 [Caenorhabditis briggsae]